MNSLYERIADCTRRIYDQRLSDPAVLDWTTRFPGARLFANEWPALRDEALRIAEDIAQVPRFHELMAEQTDISANDNRDWRMFVLKAYGVALPQNLAQCPMLGKLIASDSDVLTATLSFLAPGKHIPVHRGPFRGVLRFYLGLSVPTTANGDPGTALQIDGVEYRIGDGEFLLWDDTFPHEVWNHSDTLRVALLLDVRRRNMPPDLTLLSWLLIAAAGIAVRLRRGRIQPTNRKSS